MYDVNERRDLDALQRVVEDWKRHVQQLEERIVMIGAQIKSAARQLQQELLDSFRLMRTDEFDPGNDDVRSSTRTTFNNWERAIVDHMALLTGEELQRNMHDLEEIETLGETWISLAVCMFRRHYRSVSAIAREQPGLETAASDSSPRQNLQDPIGSGNSDLVGEFLLSRRV